MSSPSIRRRLLIGGLLLVSLFMGAAGFALEKAHQQSVQSALQAQLRAHLLTLLAAAGDDDQGNLQLPKLLATQEFNRPDSGLYAQIQKLDNTLFWQSQSWLGRQAPEPTTVAIGDARLRESPGLFVLDSGIGWSNFAGQEQHYIVQVAIDSAPPLAQQARFEQQLWLWLGFSGLLLVIALLALLHWGLGPLRTISQQVQRLEQGETGAIEGDVASELRPLTDNLQALLALTERRQDRLRHSLADLAHSLKTPLAILRNAQEPLEHELIEQQVQRIDEIVSYQRQQAAIAGPSHLIAQTLVAPIAERLCNSLQKLYPQPPRDWQIKLPEDFTLRMDSGDLLELLGNLLENAFRHAQSQVRVTHQASTLLIEDDGPGFAPAQVERLLQRGERADEKHPGEGIGLAVVQAIVNQYQGQLALQASALGGAQVCISLPNPAAK